MPFVVSLSNRDRRPAAEGSPFDTLRANEENVRRRICETQYYVLTAASSMTYSLGVCVRVPRADPRRRATPILGWVPGEPVPGTEAAVL
jgi:hypothetical protein